VFPLAFGRGFRVTKTFVDGFNGKLGYSDREDDPADFFDAIPSCLNLGKRERLDRNA
jgi:hypothetical protein